MEQQEFYEPPVVAQLGDFDELTCGYPYGMDLDMYGGWYYATGSRS
ncbi:lasso RiPP family leader peptide-containing protein [Streptomyces sp. NPDC002536]